MFSVSVHRGKDQQLYTCESINVQLVTEDMPAAKMEGYSIGYKIELLPNGPVIRLPDDGDHVYAMNPQGRTTGAWEWPPKGSRSETRKGEDSGEKDQDQTDQTEGDSA